MSNDELNEEKKQLRILGNYKWSDQLDKFGIDKDYYYGCLEDLHSGLENLKRTMSQKYEVFTDGSNDERKDFVKYMKQVTGFINQYPIELPAMAESSKKVYEAAMDIWKGNKNENSNEIQNFLTDLNRDIEYIMEASMKFKNNRHLMKEEKEIDRFVKKISYVNIRSNTHENTTD